MTKTGFVIANLFRKRTRTFLTLLSVIMAFLLFGLLQAVNVMFNSGADFVGATRLVTQARVLFTHSLPIRLLPQIESVPGVARVGWMQWFGGVLGDNDQIVAFAVDPVRHHDIYPEWVMPDAQWQAFANTRTGAIVGRAIADKYNFKVGDKLPMRSNIYPKKNGSMDWQFDIVGIFDGKDQQWQQNATQVFINFAYFDEANQYGSGRAGTYFIKLNDPDLAKQVADAVDKKFENSPDETKTQTEKDWNIGFVKQFGDIGMMVRWILAAVFFTLLLVVANTMAQSMRERVPEFAVLKTLGFSDGSVLAFVLAEAVAMCAIGGLLGLGFATLAGLGLQRLLGATLPLSVDGRVWLAGIAAIVVLSLTVGLLPALRARRLKIVDALADR